MGKRRIPVDTFGIKGDKIWPKKSTLPVGYTFQSKFGRQWEITENCGSGKYKVFSDGVELIRDGKEVRNKQILHPLDRTVHGRGYLGIGKHNRYENKHRSDCWRAMLKRCYADDDHYRSYESVNVCPEWENFQNFAEWYDNNYIVGCDLDKDLKDTQSIKMYCPDTCCFLPPKLNKQLSNAYEALPTKEGKRYRARMAFNGKTYELGRFLCWKNALCAQVIGRFSAIEGEIRTIFGDSFVERYWSAERLYSMMYRSVKVAESKI